jgi:hypothetical protein
VRCCGSCECGPTTWNAGLGNGIQEKWWTGPPGSYRSDGNLYLSPESNTEASEGIGRVHETEAPISADMRAVEAENTVGGWLEGFGYRLKDDDRLKERSPSG